MDDNTTFTRAASAKRGGPARNMHRFANPGRFLRAVRRTQPWLNAASLLLTLKMTPMTRCPKLAVQNQR
jgi:hypothetical protein